MIRYSNMKDMMCIIVALMNVNFLIFSMMIVSMYMSHV